MWGREGAGGWVVFLPDQVDEGEVEWQSAVRPLTGQWLQLLHLWNVRSDGIYAEIVKWNVENPGVRFHHLSCDIMVLPVHMLKNIT